MATDSISINSIAALGNVTHHIHQVMENLEDLYNNQLQHLSTNLNAALSGSALGQFESHFLGWLKTLYNISEDMHDAYNNLELIYASAKLIADTLSKLNYTDTPTPNPF